MGVPGILASSPLALALAACAALTTIDPSPPAAAAVGAAPSVAGTPYRDWKGIVHCHGRLSHDSDGTEEQILAACAECGIRFVVMTDHQTDASIRDGLRGVRDGVLFVVGAEVRSPQGTLLAFPLQRPLRRWQHVALLAKEAEAQGAVTFVCHAELWRVPWDFADLTGAEVVNLHAGAMTVSYGGTLATALFLPLRALMERICVRDERVFGEWDRLLRDGRRCVPVGGDDAHANVRVFGPLGGTIGDYREVFATLSTHVLAERLDEPSVVAAFRAGRTYVSFDVFGDGTGFDFRAVRGGVVVLGGGDVEGGPDTSLVVSLPAPGRIRLFRDGVVEREVDGLGLHAHAPAAGVYRVEVATPDGEPWLFSSTIGVVAPPSAP